MSLLQELVEKFQGCVVPSCSKQGCTLSVQKMPPSSYKIIDADEYARLQGYTGKLCDYFLFVMHQGALGAAVVEMKSGGVKASTVIAQLQAGADESSRILRQEVSGRGMLCKFFPILLHRGISTQEVKILRQKRISFGSKKHRVILERCGSELEEILRKY